MPIANCRLPIPYADLSFLNLGFQIAEFGFQVPDAISSLCSHGIDGAAVTCGAIDRAIRLRLQILHLAKLLIDHPMHSCHLAGGAFRTFVIACEVLFYMTVGAIHAKRPAIAEVYDEKQPPCRHTLKPLNVFEDSLCWFILMSRNTLRYLLHESVIDLLIR